MYGRILAIILAAATLASCNRPVYRRAEGVVWGTVYHITYRSDHCLDDSIVAEMERVNMALSLFEPQSLLSRLNAGVTDSVDSRFAEVYSCAQRVWRASGGRFDPTVGPLVELWGFGSRGNTPEPDSAAVDSVRRLVGMQRTSLCGGRLKRESEAVKLDFGAIAKGYGVDCVAQALRRCGVTDYLVEIGGEVAAAGVNPAGEAWRVAVESPRTDGAPADMLTLAGGGCVATSGNYRNYRVRPDGSRYAHILDPRSGRPCQGEILSVTVTAQQCMLADALATAAMTMTPASVAALADSFPGTRFIVVHTAAPDTALRVLRLGGR